MKIDFVISYLDSTDPEWIAKYNLYKSENPQSAQENTNRFCTNMFFKYVFRGIDLYANWINNVFLIVQSESQVPKWINRKNVKIVCHDQFIPHEFLPTFNSCTIECFMHKIPGLGPLFIYSNDDMYMFNDIRPDDFFSECMPLNTIKAHHTANTQYSRMSKAMSDLVLRKLRRDTEDFVYYTPLHGQQAFSKAIFNNIYAECENDILKSITRFRNDKNLSQYFFTNYYMFSTNCAYTQNLSVKSLNLIQDFQCAADVFKNTAKLKLVCFNNNNPKRDIELYHLFEKKFPNKSKYEI